MDQESNIIEGCISGRRKAQSELYTLYSGRFYGICLRFSGSRTEAEDMLQEGFIKIYSKIASYSKLGSFEGWMKRIIVNTALNYLRDHAKERLFTPFSEEIISIPDEKDEGDGFEPLPAETMLKLVQELPEGYRIVFNLYVFEDFTHKQIAEALAISENTSKTQLMRARSYLQKKIIGLSAKALVRS